MSGYRFHLHALRRWLRPVRLGMALALLPTFASAQESEDALLVSFREEVEAVFDEYCYDCHGFGIAEGGVTLDEFSSDADLQDHDLWLAVLNNLRKSIMPPSDELQPTPEERELVARWIKDKAFALDPLAPDPGRVTLRRLNRTEYRNTIRDLMGVDYEVEAEFPQDDSGHGFDNIADVLTVSPMLLEKYFDAAQQIVTEAVPQNPLIVAEKWMGGNEFESLVEIVPQQPIFELAEGERPLPDAEVWQAGQKGRYHLDLSYYHPARVGRKFWVEHAGDYEVEFDLRLVEKYVDSQFDLNQALMVLKLNDEIVHERTLVREGWVSISVVVESTLEAGEHEVTIEIQPTLPQREKLRDLRVRVYDVTLRGPAASEYWVPPEGYTDWFPRPVPADRADRDAYRSELLGNFAERAFRRPVEASTVERLVALARSVSDQPGSNFEKGVAQAMVAVLASPSFIFREEDMDEGMLSERYAPVDEFALASRLSYFLWSSMPDEELMELARAGQLRAELPNQLERMLSDSRSDQLVENFTGQWLQTRDVETIPLQEFDIHLRDDPDPEITAAFARVQELSLIPRADRTPEESAERSALFRFLRPAFRGDYPRLGGDLREAMREETEMYFDHILREDRSVVELIDSDYTFVNEDLAEHYGLEDLGVKGESLRKVQLPEDSVRGGVLTQGTLLTVTSNPTRTSPVKRGVFILENILGAPPPPPPPNIPGLEDAGTKEELSQLSLRETLALHASDPTCASCHMRMDPLGLALENFNALGRYRENELNMPIAPEGRLISGEEFSDIRDLKQILANDRRDDFLHTLTEKMLTYALGRGMEYYDLVTIDQIVEQLEENDFRISALIEGIVYSAPFQQSRRDESLLAKMMLLPDITAKPELAQTTPHTP